MLELLKKLTQTNAPSGSEERLHPLIISEIENYVDEISTDALGNLIAHKKGTGERVMFAAHTDEIGLIVTYITEKGFLKVSNLGGVSPSSALHQRVCFTNGTIGVVALDDTNRDDSKEIRLSDLYVDIGARDYDSACKAVSLGDSAAFCGEFTASGNTVISKALDDRAGCTALIEAIKRIRTYSNDLYFVFTASEELGLRGAKASAFSVAPDYAVALDVTRTGDVPSKLQMAVRLGGGAAIKIKDSSFLAHPYMKQLMTNTCEKCGISHQYEVLERGGTDSGAIHLSGGGVVTGCISIPTRYIHSPAETIDLRDLESAAALAAAMIEKGFHME